MRNPNHWPNSSGTVKNKITSVVGSAAFRPYSTSQAHLTFIGLEGIRVGKKIENHWFLKNYGESRLVSPADLLKFINSDSFPSIQIQLGGYQTGINYGFKSRNKPLYERSFSLQRDIAVTYGMVT